MGISVRAVGVQRFRAGVVIVVRHHDDDRVLAFERTDVPGAWQLPQGGIDKGEEPIDAARRELAEETGLGADDVELVGEYPEWVVYELPAELRAGQDRPRPGAAVVHVPGPCGRCRPDPGRT